MPNATPVLTKFVLYIYMPVHFMIRYSFFHTQEAIDNHDIYLRILSTDLSADIVARSL